MHSNTLYFFECEEGFVPDNGQDDVTNGSIENYPPDDLPDAETSDETPQPAEQPAETQAEAAAK